MSISRPHCGLALSLAFKAKLAGLAGIETCSTPGARKSQGTRLSLLSKATCAAPICERPKPCRGRTPDHVRRGMPEPARPHAAHCRNCGSGPQQETAEAKPLRRARGVGRVHKMLRKRPNKTAMSGSGRCGGKGRGRQERAVPKHIPDTAPAPLVKGGIAPRVGIEWAAKLPNVDHAWLLAGARCRKAARRDLSGALRNGRLYRETDIRGESTGCNCRCSEKLPLMLRTWPGALQFPCGNLVPHVTPEVGAGREALAANGHRTGRRFRPLYICGAWSGIRASLGASNDPLVATIRGVLAQVLDGRDLFGRVEPV